MFMPSCFQHVLDDRNWDKLKVNGVLIGKAVENWINGASVRLIDDCGWFACNSGCKTA